MDRCPPFSLQMLPLEVTLCALGEATLPPFLGSALRGVIGHALLHNRQAYDYFYCNRRVDGSGLDTANPYVLTLPPEGKTAYAAGETIVFRLLLLGGAAAYARAMVDALRAIEHRGLGVARVPFQLIEVRHGVHDRFVWSDGVFYPAAARPVPLPVLRLEDVAGCKLAFHTPLRIRRKGVPLRAVDAPTLLRNLVARTVQACERYGDGADADEAARLREAAQAVRIETYALRWRDLTRYSGRIHAKMEIGGLVGTVALAGDLTPFVPWIHAARILHIGKNTTFGLGYFSASFR
ncbi:MAG: CRISPR system precrRNA processing endoribonuclease RAMP protein Cas6 [Oscillospiraceae bacterium]|nr:CRISPR system precrRNA processing endoribonuclease RAMP protein Cas6 [Oscillospiraceae bacterium]